MSLVQNKKVFLKYEILEKYEAGIELLGFEVKTLKSGRGSLDGAYVIIRGGEAYLINSEIPPYQMFNTPKGYDPRQNRRLLLTKKEIAELADYADGRGLTLVPISVYNKGRKIKVEVGVARGLKKYDKRELLKKRESQRDVDRTLKERSY
ncbi:MAG: SsrA-binding protein SmpB [Candidatus Vogelbacteria bacterium]|nr:SsrA-binding protein SmpB [Candidatus Vogelbacteria bacterium]